MAGTLLPIEIRVPVLALRLALALRGVAIDDARAASVAALLQPAQEPPLARRPRASARRRSTAGTDARSRALPRARSRRASSDSSFTPRPSLRARRSRVGVDDFSTDRLHPCVREAPLERGVARFGRIEHGRGARRVLFPLDLRRACSRRARVSRPTAYARRRVVAALVGFHAFGNLTCLGNPRTARAASASRRARTSARAPRGNSSPCARFHSANTPRASATTRRRCVPRVCTRAGDA